LGGRTIYSFLLAFNYIASLSLRRDLNPNQILDLSSILGPLWEKIKKKVGIGHRDLLAICDAWCCVAHWMYYQNVEGKFHE
jgi:hypothetical protein